MKKYILEAAFPSQAWDIQSQLAFTIGKCILQRKPKSLFQNPFQSGRVSLITLDSWKTEVRHRRGTTVLFATMRLALGLFL